MKISDFAKNFSFKQNVDNKFSFCDTCICLFTKDKINNVIEEVFLI